MCREVQVGPPPSVALGSQRPNTYCASSGSRESPAGDLAGFFAQTEVKLSGEVRLTEIPLCGKLKVRQETDAAA